MIEKAHHWENVYRNKSFDAVSWYAPHLAESLRLIVQLCLDKTAAIVDIGAGESTLVDDLLQRHYLDLSVLDISATAIEFTKQRLGTKAAQVSWHVGDITRYDFASKQFDLWHDRAVFHFLTEPSARRSYIELVRRSVQPGGYVLMATFGPDGPRQCSGSMWSGSPMSNCTMSSVTALSCWEVRSIITKPPRVPTSSSCIAGVAEATDSMRRTAVGWSVTT
jgi:SAM-dependent methyltransferase